jgi:PEP-CTERM motif-containing protein
MRVRNTRNSGLLRVAAAAAVVGMGIGAQVRGDALDVELSQTGDGNTQTGTSSTAPNLGITPTTYTPALSAIPYAPGATYDAADTGDSGTLWNTLLAPSNNAGSDDGHVIAPSAATTVTFQANLPLADSTGAPTTVSLAYVAEYLPSSKSDEIHTNGVTGVGTDSQGLTANPTSLMSHSWTSSSTSENLVFQLTGLTPNANFTLYIYGGGPNGGNGGSYSLATANQGTGYGTGTSWVATGGVAGAGAYLTVPNTISYHSVFSANGGNNPAPEQGLSWVLLPAMADANGNLQFFVETDNDSGSKGFINGFQLDGAITVTPEPASIAMLGAAALGLLGRRRREN